MVRLVAGAVVLLCAIVLSACTGFSLTTAPHDRPGEEGDSSATGEKEAGAITRSRIPPIDAAAPVGTETATFALG
jgi:hypothetical protein